MLGREGYFNKSRTESQKLRKGGAGVSDGHSSCDTPTNRGSSSILIVKLKNQGHTAYQHETYGDSIIVERHFSRAGTSGFKLKSASGRTISTKKADLDGICDYFALQIDNPMNVLTQDMSRQFLNSSSPREKYKFFVKGVQLEQLDQDYKIMAELIDGIESKLRAKLDDVGILNNRSNEAQKRLEMSDKQNSLRDRVRGLGRQMAWAQVEEQEQILVSCDNEIQATEEQITKAELDATTADDKYQGVNHSFERAAGVAEMARQEIPPIQDDEQRIHDEYEKAKSDGATLMVRY